MSISDTTDATDATDTVVTARPTDTVDRRHIPAWIRFPAMVALALFLLAITKSVTDARDLTSPSIWGTVLRLTVPIMLAGLAGLWAERVGIVNIGIEGMMILGTWFGAWGAYKWGGWIGLGMAILGGVLGGLIHAVATVRFNVDHVISGVALNLLAFGGMRYLSAVTYGINRISNSPVQRSGIARFNIPFLAGGEIFGWKTPSIFGWVADRDVAILSDMARILRGLCTGVSAATLIAFALVAVTWFVLWRTTFGLRVRSSGEAPSAAESLGVRVLPLRFAALAVSGAFAGLAGGYLSIVTTDHYQQGQTQSKGYIGLATTIFGNWRPSGVMGGAMLFGFADTLNARGKPESVPSLFILFTFIAGLLIVFNLYRRKATSAAAAAVVGGLLWLAYWRLDRLPESLTHTTPYVVTLIVLAVASQRLRPPAHAGQPYRSGEDH